ncbi:hypothetical protein HWV62_31145 [Athelia sp. TMB]|nr:hypothetical protein HWV62_31145 [Athelia sp. TMB]
MTDAPAADVASAPLPAAVIDKLAILARQEQVLSYVLLTCLTICVWNWILAASDEWRMFHIKSRQPRLSFFLNAVYMLVRISVLGWCITNFLLSSFGPQLAEFADGPAIELAPWPKAVALPSIVFECLTLPTASFLFYVRLSAIYLHDKKAMSFFAVLWGSVLAYFIFDGVESYKQYHTFHIIIPGRIHAWDYIINLIYDTLVYLSVSWQLAGFSVGEHSRKQRILAFTTGKGLLGLSKALLRNGQLYYLCAVFLYFIQPVPPDFLPSTNIMFGVATIICLYSDQVTALAYKSILAPLHVCFASILACQVYRELKLGMIVNTSRFSTLFELGTLDDLADHSHPLEPED